MIKIIKKVNEETYVEKRLWLISMIRIIIGIRFRLWNGEVIDSFRL